MYWYCQICCVYCFFFFPVVQNFNIPSVEFVRTNLQSKRHTGILILDVLQTHEYHSSLILGFIFFLYIYLVVYIFNPFFIQMLNIFNIAFYYFRIRFHFFPLITVINIFFFYEGKLFHPLNHMYIQSSRSTNYHQMGKCCFTRI